MESGQFYTLAERQEYELQLLQAIYMDDVVDMRQAEKELAGGPPVMRIRLFPQESLSAAEAHTSISLIVTFTRCYPDDVPLITLEDAKCLSNQQVATLKQQLEDLAQKQIGQEMVLVFCQHVQTYLRDHNKPPTKSFYDEMLLNHQRNEQKEAQKHERRLELERRKQQKQIQQIDEAIRTTEDAWKEDMKRRRELARQASEDSDQSAFSPSCSPTDRFGFMKSCAYGGQVTEAVGSTVKKFEDADTITFHGLCAVTVRTGKRLGHSVSRGTEVYCGLEESAGEVVAINQWCIHLPSEHDLVASKQCDLLRSKIEAKLCSVKDDLMPLLSLKHKNIVHYIGIAYNIQPTVIKVQLLTEYVGGGSLLRLLQALPMPLDMLRYYTKEILNGLSYLHHNNVVHGDLRLSSLFLDNDCRVRIADFVMNKRLSDLMAAFRTNSNLPPHNAEQKASRKEDIFSLGLVVLSLVRGKVANSFDDIPLGLPPELVDFLKRCEVSDDVQQLSSHTFVKKVPFGNLAETQHHTTQQRANAPVLLSSPLNEVAADDSQEVAIISSFINSGSSRLYNEFEILCEIGRGAFGDVIKVRNKLDGRCYAIKRISLNPRKKLLMKKITREVKLLSRLNHENVVRYYNSWIETVDQAISSGSPSTQSPSSKTTSKSPSKSSHVKASTNLRPVTMCIGSLSGIIDKKVDKLTATNDMNRLQSNDAASDDSIKWDSSRDSDKKTDSTSDESSDEQDENGAFGGSFMLFPDDDSDSDESFVQFAQEDADLDNNDSSSDDDDDEETDGLHSLSSSVTDHRKTLQKLHCLYIQMEFCEKSTLRDCIDAGLYRDTNRVWQLFREIVEGLVHIHEQGIIHRDLKPVNIFLHSDDHVKIGDFGLATTEVVETVISVPVASDLSSKTLDSGDVDCSLTGRVGTALYVSPEMMKNTSHYNQKVDIYSLGIIFFEMCYRPMSTGMERVKILSSIRQPSIDFPDDFNELELENQAAVVRLLLNHDPSKRPTSKELLKSRHVPPPRMEESELHEVLRSTISDPKSSAFKQMINSIFSPSVTSPDVDFAYDSSLYKVAASSRENLIHKALVQVYVGNTVEQIFRNHAAVRINMPLLMPRSSLHIDTYDTYACMMDHSGGIVCLPHDSKVPFSRYIARTGMVKLKRYSLENVFRENRFPGVHPRELCTCCFDVVSPSAVKTLVPDAEVISVVYEIISAFDSLSCRNYRLRINHTELVKAVLIHCGIAESQHADVLSVLSGVNKTEKQQRIHVRTRLASLSLSDQSIDQLCEYIIHEGEFRKIVSLLRSITKTPGQAGSLAKKGIHELEAILSLVDTLGCKFPPYLAIGLMTDLRNYNGVMFQVFCETKRNGRTSVDVIAAGGRYDPLIRYFRKPDTSNVQSIPGVVGVTIAFDRVVASVANDKEEAIPAMCDVLISSLKQRSSSYKEQLNIARELWSIGVAADIHLDDDRCSYEDLKDYCRTNRIVHLVVLKDSELSLTKMQPSEKDRVIKKDYVLSDLVDYFKQRKSSERCDVSEATSNVTAKSQLSSAVTCSGDVSSSIYGGGGGGSTGSSTVTSNVSGPANITFVFADSNKLAKNAKRQYESQIVTNIAQTLAHFSSRSRVEVLAVDLNSSIIKALAVNLDLSKDEDTFSSSAATVPKEFPRFKKYIMKITDEIHDLKYENNRHVSVIILYSLPDDVFRVLM